MTVLLLLPGNELPQERWFEIIYLDKLVHISFFAFTVYLFYTPLKKPSRESLLIIIFTTIAYGVAIEFIQKYWIPDRSFDVLDIVADTAGTIAGGIVAWVIAKK